MWRLLYDYKINTLVVLNDLKYTRVTARWVLPTTNLHQQPLILCWGALKHSHIPIPQDSTYHSLCYTSWGALAEHEIAQWVHLEGSIQQPTGQRSDTLPWSYISLLILTIVWSHNLSHAQQDALYLYNNLMYYNHDTMNILHLLLYFIFNILFQKYPRFWPKELDKEEKYGPIVVKYLGCGKYPELIIRAFTIHKVCVVSYRRGLNSWSHCLCLAMVHMFHCCIMYFWYIVNRYGLGGGVRGAWITTSVF